MPTRSAICDYYPLGHMARPYTPGVHVPGIKGSICERITTFFGGGGGGGGGG